MVLGSKTLSLLLGMLASIVCCGKLKADIVTHFFSGTVTKVNSGGQQGPSIGSVSNISIGSSFTATFSYQTNNAGADLNASTSLGLFSISPSVDTFLTVNINGNNFQKSGTSNLGVQTFNNVVSDLSNSSDLISLFSNAPLLPANWSVPNPNTSTVRLVYIDPSGLAMPNDSLPNTFSPLWSNATFSLSFNDQVTTPSGTITGLYIEGTVTAVPEPSSIACVAIGGMGLAFARRFARRRPSL